ncbi:MAG TPA: SUF system NifU family Fe-S cluster assembly protein [Polyangiaceae bacterium]|jgi:nitrogen fixation NifU-like protein
MSELSDLYQEFILDHSRSPRNFRSVPNANRHARGYNPLCGDRVTLTLRVEDGVVADIGFEGSGCAISTAAASTMTEAVKGKPVEEVEKMFEGFHELLTGKSRDASALPTKLRVFQGVCAYPMRVKCATLAWHALHNALQSQDAMASTE